MAGICIDEGVGGGSVDVGVGVDDGVESEGNIAGIAVGD